VIARIKMMMTTMMKMMIWLKI